MSITAIRNALQKRLQTMEYALSTAWEDSRYSPTAGNPFQKVNLLPAEPINKTICKGDGDLTYEHGIFQVALYYPQFSGPNAAATQADRIKTRFHRGLTMTEDGIDVIVDATPSVAPLYVDSGWTVTPVSIPYYSFVRTT